MTYKTMSVEGYRATETKKKTALKTACMAVMMRPRCITNWPSELDRCNAQSYALAASIQSRSAEPCS